MSEALRIAVADDEPEMRDYLQTVLPRLGHRVVATAENGRQLLECCRREKPDLVITDIKMPGLDGITAALAAHRERPTPVIVVTAYHEPQTLAQAAAGNVMAYLVKPVKEADLKAAITVAMRRFGQLLDLAREAAETRQALEDRKLIERAKGVVVKRTLVDEEEAYRRLRKLASDSNSKLVEVARSVAAAEEIFHCLDRLG
jgi:AmiR/NasT family two-component response regulator